MDRGWIKLWCKSVDSRVFANEGLWKVWTWCLMKATRREWVATVNTGRGSEKVKLQPGQFIFGRHAAAKELGMPPSTVRNRINRLKKLQNVDIQKATHYSVITIINWETYQPQKEKEDKQEDTQRTGIGQAKDTKESSKSIKSKPKTFRRDSDEYRLSVFLFNHIKEHNPGHKEPNFQAWAKEADLLLRYDKRPLEKVKKVIQWCQRDTFWYSKVLSMAKLRKQFDTLSAQMNPAPVQQKRDWSAEKPTNFDLPDGEEYA